LLPSMPYKAFGPDEIHLLGAGLPRRNARSVVGRDQPRQTMGCVAKSSSKARFFLASPKS
jgi:hypothetical protein